MSVYAPARANICARTEHECACIHGRDADIVMCVCDIRNVILVVSCHFAM